MMKHLLTSISLTFLLTTSSFAQSDNLPLGSLEDAGFNQDSIDQLFDELDELARKDFRGVLVIKDEHIILESYYNTFWRKTIHDIRSAGKSITALLLGVALQDGLIKDLDQDLYSLFSTQKNPVINEDYKKIKLRHLLNMASGLDADTDNSETLGHVGRWIGSDDWKAYILNVPLTSEPGDHFTYADINAVLIGLAIEEASGMCLRDYAQEKLFGPLGFEPIYWYTNAANQTGGAGNLYLTTLDFAKLGLLVLNDGQWNGRQLIAPEYIEALINSKDYAIADYWNIADFYGMLWYKTSRNFGGRQFDYVWASGSGGNHLVVVPEANIVVAITSGAYGRGYGQGRSYHILSKILAALE